MSVTSLSQVKNQNVVVVFVDKDKKILSKWKDKVLFDFLKTPLQEDFNGDYREALLVYTDSHPIASRVLMIGVGDASQLSLQKLRILAAEMIKALRQRHIRKKVGIFPPPLRKLSLAETLEALYVGAQVFQYEFTELRSKASKQEDRQIEFEFIVEDAKQVTLGKKAVERARIISEGVNFGRRLINLPGGHIGPDELCSEVAQMVKSSKSKAKIKVELWTEAQLKKAKYGGILAVGQGSDRPSRMIVLQYRNAPKSKKPITLVGKGVTFDSGGLSLKAPVAQEYMKYDMGGAATVLSAFKMATDMQLKINLNLVVATVENMPSGKAIRPGDVITMANGKTVEVLNTDAEGRLILADALYHACEKLESKAIVNCATLTGACAMIVGDAAAGLYGNDDKVRGALMKASEQTGEHLFPLPDFKDFYGDQLKSEVADLRNIGRGRLAGATTAGMFLEEFISKDIPWSHVDIAGCGWYEAPRDFIGARGPSGVPIRAIFQFIENFSS